MGNIQKFHAEVQKFLLSINRVRLKEIFQELTEFFTLEEIINNLIYPVLENIGKLWENGNIALSQVYMSGKLCEGIIMDSLMQKEKIKTQNIKIGLVNLEDYHPLGIEIIESILKTSGYKTKKYDIGITVDALYDEISKEKVDILMISTLMLRSALKIRDLTEKLKNSDTYLPIVVGGAPFNFDDDLWKKVGADGMGKNAFKSITLINKITGIKK